MAEYSRNDELLNRQASAKLYDKLSRLHLEMAGIYAELASHKLLVDNAEKVVPIRSNSGKLLANLSLMNNKAKVEVVSHLTTDNAPYTWLKSHLKSLTEKDETLRFRFGEKDGVLEYVEIEGSVTPDLSRKLESACRWALSRMIADSGTASDAPQPVSKSDTVEASVISKGLRR